MKKYSTTMVTNIVANMVQIWYKYGYKYGLQIWITNMECKYGTNMVQIWYRQKLFRHGESLEYHELSQSQFKHGKQKINKQLFMSIVIVIVKDNS